jgi:transglutaminase/protease-like cytokinesis protein 3
MNLRFSRLLLLFAFLLASSIATDIVWESPAYAANDSASTLTELQTKLDTAIRSKPAAYNITYSGGALTKTNLNAILAAIYDTDDYLLYSTKSYGYTLSSDRDSSTINFTFTYWETVAQSNDVAAKVSEILSQILTAGMNDFQKQKAIHDWIETNLSYDTTLAQHSAYAGLFGSKKTVCQGYALLAYRMLTDAGLENRIIEGTAGGQLHTWNLVNLEGKWYHLDTTWDDPVPDVADRTTYGYYNLTDAQIKTNHSWKKKYPAANTEFAAVLTDKINSDAASAAFYEELQQSLGLEYLKDELTASTPAQLSAKVKETLAAGQPSFTVRYTSKRSIANDLKAAMNGFGNITQYSYSSPDFMRTSLSNDVLLTVNLTYGDAIALMGITLNENSIIMNVRDNTPLITSIQPTNASNKNITWSSSNSSIATVSAKGVVTGKAAGTAIITATTVDGNFTASVDITVIQPVTRVTLNKTSVALKVGDPDFALITTIAPSTATVQAVTWLSNNPAVATVDDNGVVHAVSAGKATITAKTANGKNGSSLITVKP